MNAEEIWQEKYQATANTKIYVENPFGKNHGQRWDDQSTIKMKQYKVGANNSGEAPNPQSFSQKNRFEKSTFYSRIEK